MVRQKEEARLHAPNGAAPLPVRRELSTSPLSTNPEDPAGAGGVEAFAERADSRRGVARARDRALLYGTA